VRGCADCKSKWITDLFAREGEAERWIKEMNGQRCFTPVLGKRSPTEGPKTLQMFIVHAVPWIIPLAITGIASAMAHWFLVQRLRQLYPTVWLQLGSPGNHIFSTSIRDGWNEEKAGYRLFLFIWSGRHAALQDSIISRLVWGARIGYGFIAIFIAFGLVNRTLALHS
jgi:hypothetical protein